MEFGRLPVAELNKVNFRLPAEPAENKAVLGKRSRSAKVYVGCAKWGRREWIGKIYPKGTREKDFLKQYVRHYNSIELNAVHHKLYGAKGIAEWAKQAVGRDFVFCPKMYKGVTHAGKLGAKPYLLKEYFRGIDAFGTSLGAVFLQMNETFSPKRKVELFAFLESLPKNYNFFLEVRHADWFAKKEEREGLFKFLRKQKIGAVITDTAGRRDCAHMRLTVPKAFIRFVGNSLHPTDYSRIGEWARRMKQWLDRGIKEIYFFMHMHDEATSPELSEYLVDKVNKVCKLDLQRPLLIEDRSK